MRFLFVDRIDSISERSIAGSMTYSLREPFRHEAGHGIHGDPVLAQGIIAEAVGQLASWLALERNAFSGRPVFLFADRINVHDIARPGDTVKLSAKITDLNDETLRFEGEARSGDRLIQSIRDCSGYFMPLAELEDPEVARLRFRQLCEGGIKLSNVEGDAFSVGPFIDGCIHEAEKTVAKVRIPDTAPFFADHFPRFPVAPIVVLNELISCIAARRFGCRLAIPEHIEEVKIRSFIRPGESFAVVLKIHEGNERRLVAEISKDGKRILRGVYQFGATGADAQ